MIRCACQTDVVADLSRDDPLRPPSPRLRSPRSICDVLPSAAALLSVSGAVDMLGVTEWVGDVRRVAVVLGKHGVPRRPVGRPARRRQG